MPPREQVSYFGAGPAPLPTAVLEEATKALLNYNDMGIGIAEMSHRSADANKVLAEAKNALSDLLEIPEDYEILFLQGGGSGEFSAVVYNLVSIWVEKTRKSCEDSWKGTELENADENTKLSALKKVVEENLRLDYLVTGSWSLKASQEAARLVGAEHVHITVDSREHNNGKFGMIPPEANWKSELPQNTKNLNLKHKILPALTYFCDNETVDGVEFPQLPKSLVANSPDDERLIVADMSSNFLSRKVDVRRYAVIFGGAQKNIGNTGITIVILRKSLLPPHSTMASPELLRKLNLPVGPVVLDWPTIAKNNSLYNTLPIFDVWIAGQVMKRLVAAYGSKRIAGQEEISNQKSQLIYSTLDAHPEVYQVVPSKESRSRMNICLRVKHGDAEAEKAFISGAEKRNLTGLKGHRSVGGIRISNYNAVTLESVKKLVQYLNDYVDEKGASS